MTAEINKKSLLKVPLVYSLPTWPKIERLLFYIFVAITLMLGAVLSFEGISWLGYSHSLDDPPVTRFLAEREFFPGTSDLVIFTTLTETLARILTAASCCIGVAVLLQRRISMLGIALTIPLITFLDLKWDFVRYDVALFFGVVFPILLLASMFIKLRRTHVHAVVAGLVALMFVMQALVRAEIVLPSYDARDDRIQSAMTALSKSASPEEVRRLVELDLLKLAPVAGDTLGAQLEAEGAPAIESSIASLSGISEQAPPVIHSWIIKEWDHRWRALFVYDGRDGEPKGWMLQTAWSYAPVTDAIAVSATINGLLGASWMLFALLLVRLDWLRKQVKLDE